MGDIFRSALLVWVTATTCLAQSDPSGGSVNRRLLDRVRLFPPASPRTAPAMEIPRQPCRRVPWQERIPVPDVDRKMVIPFPERTGDEKMVIKPAPVCPDR